MAEPAHLAKARRLRQFASDLSELADRAEQPSRSIDRASALIAEGERIASGVRSVFRG